MILTSSQNLKNQHLKSQCLEYSCHYVVDCRCQFFLHCHSFPSAKVSHRLLFIISRTRNRPTPPLTHSSYTTVLLFPLHRPIPGHLSTFALSLGMTWSTENILTFSTLLITVPTSIVGVWAVIQCCRRRTRTHSSVWNPAEDSTGRPDCLPTSEPLQHMGHQSEQPLAEARLLSYHHIMRALLSSSLRRLESIDTDD